MGRRGPPPKPTALKVISGSKRINKDEPKLTSASTDCPEYLKGNARAEWDRLAPELVMAGLLTIGDVSVFAGYCEAFGTWRQYEGQCEEVGPQLAVQMGYRGAADRAVERMAKLGARFGLDAASRAGLKVPGRKPEDMQKQKFFGGIVGGSGGQKA